MKVGVIGAGKWGINHVRTLQRIGALGEVAEPDDRAREAAQKKIPGASFVKDAETLLKGPSEAVIVATPVGTHFDLARAALRAGKHVLVEKPMCLRSEDADALTRLAKEKKRVLMVGHLLVYEPGIRWMRDYIQNGHLGVVYSLHQWRLNLGTARRVENALWSLGVHDIAVATWLLGGMPTRVVAAGQRLLQKTVEDDAYLHLEFASGARSHLHASWLWPSKSRGLAIVGARGMLAYDEASRVVTLHNKGIRQDLTTRDDGAQEVFHAQ
jgi:predicted dehydrogenase